MTDTSSTLSRAYRMRAYPTPEQARLLAQLAGATRHVWNWSLAKRTSAYRERGERLNWVSLSREFTEYRRDPERPWLAALPRDPFNQVLRDQERAFANFFAKRAAYPRFKRRGGNASVRFTLDQRRRQVRDTGGRWATVDLPGLGSLKLRRTEALNGRLRSIALSRDSAGRWHGAVTADGIARPVVHAPAVGAVGLDAGLRDLLVIADGHVTRRVPAPKALASKQARLRRYQRRQSRQIETQMRAQGLDPTKPCPKGVRLGCSNRRRKTQRQIGRLHAQVADLRRDALHQASAAVVREAQVIGIEDLAVKAMSRGMGRKAFRRSVADAALGELRRQLTYKAGWHGRKLIAVNRFYASSKTCGACGAIHAALKLKDRRWVCPACGMEHDRDENAAKNIRTEALRLIAASSPATPRSGESDARGEAAAALGRTSPDGLPTSRKREPTDENLGARAARPKRLSRPRKTRTDRVAVGSG
ncbi:transposase (plasmid) [Ahniella affigens]|uniref:Transposase n=1 Tax=Ahniella affigens TaxID=2021234 RepID=A0A2P1PZI8_9GAMM|nr:RNA-guided endonuclease TnpB family protein [Ahniella affigens]AVQ00260.1 transposase [Ahniella affigens]